MPVPTITQVAKKAGVSLSTASDILNGKLKAKPETARRVQQAAKVLGYRPNAFARGLRTAQAGAFGLVVPYRRPLFTSALLTDLLSGVQSAQPSTNLNLVLASKPYDKAGEIYGADLYSVRAVDGLIVIGTRESYGRDLDKDVKALRKMKCPLVWLHYFDGEAPVDRIVRSGGHALNEVLNHLKERHRSRVGFLVNPPLKGKRSGADPKPYVTATQKAGLVTDEKWVVSGEAFEGAAFRAALELLRRPKRARPDALVCASDDMANAALQAALGLGLKVPEDIALAGLDNTSVGERAAVPITVFGPPASALGRAAVERLKALIERPEQKPEITKISGGLLVRAST